MAPAMTAITLDHDMTPFLRRAMYRMSANVRPGNPDRTDSTEACPATDLSDGEPDDTDSIWLDADLMKERPTPKLGEVALWGGALLSNIARAPELYGYPGSSSETSEAESVVAPIMSDALMPTLSVVERDLVCKLRDRAISKAGANIVGRELVQLSEGMTSDPGTLLLGVSQTLAPVARASLLNAIADREVSLPNTEEARMYLFGLVRNEAVEVALSAALAIASCYEDGMAQLTDWLDQCGWMVPNRQHIQRMLTIL